MRIFGIGIDIVETDRIADSIARHGDRFLDRVFTPAERAYCDRMRFPAPHYAARFAAKEAVAKAFGTGFGSELNWTDIEILRRPNGEPRVELHGTGKETATRLGIVHIHISLSHAQRYGAAHAVAETDQPPP